MFRIGSASASKSKSVSAGRARNSAGRRMGHSALLEPLEGRALMSTYNFSVEVDPYHVGITTGHDSGTGSLAATAVTITSDTTPSSETVLRTALTQASVTLSAVHTATLNGTYDGSGPGASNRLLFLPAEETGKNYPGTRSREESLADAFGLSGDYVVAFEDGTDFDYNDGYFLVNISNTTPPAGAPLASLPSATILPSAFATIAPASDGGVLA